MHREEIGSNLSAGGEEANEEANSPSLQIPQQSTSTFEHIIKEIERKEKLDKFNQIKRFLENMQKNLDEIEKLEFNWLIEKNKQFDEEDKNQNRNEKEEEEIQQIRIEIRKLSDTNELIKKKKENIDKLIEVKKELPSLKDYAKFKNSNNNKNKRIKDTDKPAIKRLKKLCGKIEDQLLENQNNEKELQKQINELQKTLIYKFLKLNNNLKPETEKIKEIQKQMEEPLKHLWIGYDLVIKKLDQHWKTPEMKDNYYDRLPFDYNFIRPVFNNTITNPINHEAEISAFKRTMQLTLEKMLLHQNIYKNMNFTTNVNGESISVYERLNCFDELWKKIKMLSKEIELSNYQGEDLKIKAEKMKKLGKFFKNELNQKFREVLRFIMVGLDELPDVWDQLVLNGIKKLSKWLPKNRKKQMNKIWIKIFNYYYFEENRTIQFLSKYLNDKEAENVFDLSSADDEYLEERLGKQLPIINELEERVNSLEFSMEIKKLMADAFGHIKAFIQSIKMLLKIEKREKDAKSLPYLKSVYEKYWYMIYKERFDHHFEHLKDYEFGREINQIERAKNIKELLDNAQFERNPKVKQIFQKISLVDSNILAELMKIIDVLDDFVTEIKIKERFENYENDQDFMNSIRKDNPNIEYYNSLWEELYGNDDSKDDSQKEIAEKAK